MSELFTRSLYLGWRKYADWRRNILCWWTTERKGIESFLSFRERKLSFLSWKKKNFLLFSFFFLGKERYLSFSSKAQKIFPFFAFFLSVWKNLSFLSFPKWESYLSFPRESFLSCPPLVWNVTHKPNFDLTSLPAVQKRTYCLIFFFYFWIWMLNRKKRGWNEPQTEKT